MLELEEAFEIAYFQSVSLHLKTLKGEERKWIVQGHVTAEWQEQGCKLESVAYHWSRSCHCAGSSYAKVIASCWN